MRYKSPRRCLRTYQTDTKGLLPGKNSIAKSRTPEAWAWPRFGPPATSAFPPLLGPSGSRRLRNVRNLVAVGGRADLLFLNNCLVRRCIERFREGRPACDFARHKGRKLLGCHQSDFNLVLGHALQHLWLVQDIRDLAAERSSHLGRQLRRTRKSEPRCGHQVVVPKLPESRYIGEIGEPTLR